MLLRNILTPTTSTTTRRFAFVADGPSDAVGLLRKPSPNRENGNCVVSHASEKSASRLRQSNPTGKSLPILRNRVKPPESKIFLFSRTPRHYTSNPSRPAQRGVS